ncbi:hypothetical protein QUT25_22480, partial [Xanthomonas citri pv. citri]
VAKIGEQLFEALRNNADKGAFALNILVAEDFESLKIPRYIGEGLEWLDNQLRRKQVELLSTEPEVADA